MFGRSKKRELKAAETLAAEVRVQREVTQDLVERYEQRTKKTVQAIEAASKAREQRDEYRRVLAAAIASERRQELHVTALERELKEVKDGVVAEARARGAAEAASESARARVAQLEAELREFAGKLERQRGDAADRAWAEREAARGEMVRLIARSRDEAQTLTAEVRRVLSWMGLRSHDAKGLPVEDPAVASVLRKRARILTGLALGAFLVGVALTPTALLAAVDAERAAYIQLFSGASPWQLILGAVGCFGAAVFLYSWALRDLRAPQEEGTVSQGAPASEDDSSGVQSEVPEAETSEAETPEAETAESETPGAERAVAPPAAAAHAPQASEGAGEDEGPTPDAERDRLT